MTPDVASAARKTMAALHRAPEPDVLKPLLEHIQNGKIDPSFVITHRMALEDAPFGYETFKHKKDNCIKVVLKP